MKKFLFTTVSLSVLALVAYVAAVATTSYITVNDIATKTSGDKLTAAEFNTVIDVARGIFTIPDSLNPGQYHLGLNQAPLPGIDLSIKSVLKITPLDTKPICDSGTIYFSQEDGHFWGCDGNNWIQLDTKECVYTGGWADTPPPACTTTCGYSGGTFTNTITCSTGDNSDCDPTTKPSASNQVCPATAACAPVYSGIWADTPPPVCTTTCGYSGGTFTNTITCSTGDNSDCDPTTKPSASNQVCPATEACAPVYSGIWADTPPPACTTTCGYSGGTFTNTITCSTGDNSDCDPTTKPSASNQVCPATAACLTSTIYEEGDEWEITSSTYEVTPKYSSEKYAGQYSARVLSYDSARFKSFQTLETKKYTSLDFWLKLSRRMSSYGSIYVDLYNGSSRVGSMIVYDGLDKESLEWQKVEVPLTSLPDADFDGVEVEAGLSSGQYYLDEIRFSAWNEWGECSAVCGDGTQTRTCQNASGEDCEGSASRSCNIQACPNPTIYEEGDEWEITSSTYDVTPKYSSEKYAGQYSAKVGYYDSARFKSVPTLETKKYTSLDFWLKLNGRMSSYRSIYVDLYNGSSRVGSTIVYDGLDKENLDWQKVEVPLTSLPDADFDGVEIEAQNSGDYYLDEIRFSAWNEWGECSAVCGDGTQTRTCQNASGEDCEGSASRSCNIQACPNPTIYEEGDEWEITSSTYDVTPKYSSEKYAGQYSAKVGSYDSARFRSVPTLETKKYTSLDFWLKLSRRMSSYGSINVDLYNGSSRVGSTEYDGLDKENLDWQKVEVPLTSLPDANFDGVEVEAEYSGDYYLDEIRFSAWNEWGECSAVCGDGTQTRTCQNASGEDCEGSASRSCNIQACPNPTIYEEGDEWEITSSTYDVTPKYSSEKYAGQYSAKVGSYDSARFRSVPTLETKKYTSLDFWLKLSRRMSSYGSINVDLYNGSSRVGSTEYDGLDKENLDWQKVEVPLTSLPDANFDGVEVEAEYSGDYYLDEIRLVD